MIIFQLRTLKNILLDVKWGDSGFESEKEEDQLTCRNMGQ